VKAIATVTEGPEAPTQPRTVLITGGAGFIGSHLAEAFLGRGHRVLVIDDLSTGRLENIELLRGGKDFHFARASVTDAIVLDRLMSEADIVVHLAAAVGVKLIVERPVHTIETNVMGTEAVLRSALRYGRRAIVASTSEVYGKGSRIPFAEDDDILLGSSARSRWAYAASKLVDEFLGLAYFSEFGLPVVPVRLFNTIGPRQTGHYGMVVPRFMRSALEGEAIKVYGDGTQSRCFCDVRDVVRALIALAFHPESPGNVFNIGTTEETTILALAEKTRAIAGSKSEIRFVPYAEAYAPGFEDVARRVPSTARIERLLGWKPEYSLDEILVRVRDAMTVEGEL
jgi:nucleoside-diphosphate-sugar epimerase